MTRHVLLGVYQVSNDSLKLVIQLPDILIRRLAVSWEHMRALQKGVTLKECLGELLTELVCLLTEVVEICFLLALLAL